MVDKGGKLGSASALVSKLLVREVEHQLTPLIRACFNPSHVHTTNKPRRRVVWCIYNERCKQTSELVEANTTKPPLNQASRETTSEAAPSKKPLENFAVDEARDDASRS
jgi:hypothetical protein